MENVSRNDVAHATPPTVALRKELLRHRLALAEVNLAARPDTPDYAKVAFTSALHDRPRSAEAEAEAAAAAAAATLSDLVLYTNPALTMLFLLGGVLALSASSFLLRGAYQWSVLPGARAAAAPPSPPAPRSPAPRAADRSRFQLPTSRAVLCHLALGEMAKNFLKSAFSFRPHSAGAWRGSPLAAAAKAAASRGVDAAAGLHDAYLTARDPAIALRVACGLWAVAVAGRYLSAWSVAALVFGAAFTLPVAAQAHRPALEAAAARAAGAARARWAALALSRRQRFGALAFGGGALFLRCAWPTRVIGTFVAALAVRCCLKPAEVEALREHAAPLTMSVKKRAARLSLAASGFAERTLGAKAHAR
jgi:hypothetical protein